jgi:hypothetical protein
VGKRYRLISGYWAFDLRFLRRHRNCGEDFLLLLLVFKDEAAKAVEAAATAAEVATLVDVGIEWLVVGEWYIT